LPDGIRTRFHLSRLRRPAALAAVNRPLEMFGERRRKFARGVDEKLVDELLKMKVYDSEGRTREVLGEVVEPVQLQVVCDTLWKSLPANVKEITERDLLDFGDVNEALIKFYEMCIEEATQKSGVKEGVIRNWFGEVLITPLDTKALVYRFEQHTGGLANDAVDALEDLHLIRSERRGGVSWYEITHDRLIEPIRSSNRLWRERLGTAAETQSRLEERAREWVRLGRSQEKLLDEIDLDAAERWTQSSQSEELGVSANLIALIERSASELAKRKATKDQILSQAVQARLIAEQERGIAQRRLQFVLLIILVSTLVYGGWRWLKFKRQSASQLSAFTTEIQHQGQEGQKMVSQANSKALSWASLFLLRVSPIKSLTLALEAFHKADTPEAESALGRAVSEARELTLLRGAGSKAFRLAVSPDGNLLAVGGDAGTATLWNRQEGKSIRQQLISGSGDSVNAVAFGLNGRILATGSLEGTVTLWSLNSPPVIIQQIAVPGAIFDLSFNKDSSLLSAATAGGFVVVWKLPTGYGSDLSLKATEEGKLAANSNQDPRTQPSPFYAVAFDPSPDRSNLLAAANSDAISLWSTSNISPNDISQPVASVPIPNLVYSIAFDQSGKKMAVASADKTAKFYELTDDAVPHLVLSNLKSAPFTHDDILGQASLSPSGKLLATCSNDKTVKLWDVKSGKLLWKYIGHTSGVMGVVFSPNERTLYSSSWDNTVRVWPISDSQNLVGSTEAIDFLSVTQAQGGSTLAATASQVGQIKVWDLSADSELETETVQDPSGRISAIALSNDGTSVLIARPGASWERVHIGGTPIKTAAKLAMNSTGSNTAISFGPDANHVAMAFSDGSVMVRQIKPFAAHKVTESDLKIEAQTDRITSVTLDSSEQKLAIGTLKGKLRIANWVTHRVELPSAEFNAAIDSIAFSPDGSFLFVGYANEKAVIWDARLTGYAPVGSRAGSVNSAIFSPDGSHLATASSATVEIWKVDKQKGKLTSSLVATRVFADTINSVAFDPAGQNIIAVGKDMVIHKLPVSNDGLEKIANDHYNGAGETRDLSAPECEEYLDRPSPCPLAVNQR
jgi:WD40 repeat protein